ncbi:MAG: motility associated factor glycosyltransferase family protein [Vampirovibrionia bacterium]
MFEKNLKALSRQNPLLANKLRAMNFQNIEAFASQSGDINISYNNTDLHSNNNPIEEALNLFESHINENSLNTFYIVYGLGIGYLFKRSYVTVKGKIILFEPFLDVLRFTLEFVDFSKEIEDKRVFVCTTIDEVLAILNNKFIVGDKIEITYLPTYINLNPDCFNTLTNKTIELLKTKKQDQNTLLARSANWGLTTFNHLENIINALPVDKLTNKFDDIPVVIVSAGPTLNDNIELLKQNRNKYLLLTVNSALKSLLSNDIVPDFCIISENYMIDKQFEGLKNLDQINYILHSRAQNYCWKLNNKNFVYFTEPDGFAIWYNKQLNDKYNLWPSAGSVSLLAFYIAFKVLESKNIILVGQDLAFINNEMYSSKVFDNNIETEIKDNRLFIKHTVDETIENKYNIKLIKIKNSYGEEITTRIDYYDFIKQFEDIIKNEVPPEIKVINTSLNGAYIEGMVYKTLKDFFNTDKYKKVDTLKIINDTYSTYKEEIEDNKQILLPKIKAFYHKLEVILNLSLQLKILIELFNNKYATNPMDKDLIAIINSFYQQKRTITNFISEEEVIFFIMQKDYLTLSNNYVIPEENKPLNIHEHYNNLNEELSFIDNLIGYFTTLKNHNFLK